MRFLFCLGILAASTAFAGIAAAGDGELLALRGETGTGLVQVNAFEAPWNPVRPPGGQSAIDALFAMPSGAGPFRPGGYVRWKYDCHFMPAIVSGPVLAGKSGGFGRTPAYSRKPPVAEPGFLELLAETLAGDD